MIQISPRLGAAKPPPAAPPSPLSSLGEGDSAAASVDSGEVSDTDASSSAEPQESILNIMNDLKSQMASIEVASKELDGQVKQICRRAKEEQFDWAEEPLRPANKEVRSWLREHGLSDAPTLKEFMEAVFDSAKSLDLATRVITVRREDAAVLWSGQRRLTVFEILSNLSNLFE